MAVLTLATWTHNDTRALWVVTILDSSNNNAALDISTMTLKLYMHPVSTVSRPVRLFIAEKHLPVTEQVATEILNVPLFVGLTSAELERVCATIRACARTASSAVILPSAWWGMRGRPGEDQWGGQQGRGRKEWIDW